MEKQNPRKAKHPKLAKHLHLKIGETFQNELHLKVNKQREKSKGLEEDSIMIRSQEMIEKSKYLTKRW